MRATPTPETPETAEEREFREVAALAMQLTLTEREKLAWAIIQSIHPELRPAMFASTAELNAYLATKPDAVVTGS